MALGRALLAELPDAELDNYLGSVDLKPFTPFTIVDSRAVHAAITEVRRRGYALSDREYDIGVRALAVPVRNRSGVAVAAIDVAVDPQLHAIETLVERALPVLKAAAREISDSLPG
jgi:IclR family pca regulon transcriptional regulator